MVILEHLDANHLRGILLSDNSEPREQFLRHFSTEIDTFVRTLARACERLAVLAERVPTGKRVAWVDEFLFVGMNNLLTAVHLLASGFSLPFGNLMRHYGEASAMALLLSHPETHIFEKLDKDPGRFPVHLKGRISTFAWRCGDLLDSRTLFQRSGQSSMRPWRCTSPITTFAERIPHYESRPRWKLGLPIIYGTSGS